MSTSRLLIIGGIVVLLLALTEIILIVAESVRKPELKIFGESEITYARNLEGLFAIMPEFFEPHETWQWHGKPHWFGNYWHGLVRLNSQGYRSKELIQQPPDDSFLILCLGDSITFGWGVTQEHAFPERVRLLLSRKCPEREVQAINAGFPYHTSRHGLQHLKKLLADVTPTLLIINYGIFDQKLTGPNGEGILNQEYNLTRSLGGLSKLKLVKHSLSILDRVGIIDLTPYDKAVSPDQYEQNIQEMIRLAKQRGVKVILVAEAHSDQSRILYESALRNLSRKEFVPLVSVRQVFERRPKDKSYRDLYLDLYHPNYLGHELIAQSLFATIQREFPETRCEQHRLIP